MIGERIHNYEINAHLGEGGMGNVFRATDNMLGREVALKMLHPQLTIQPQFLERFKKEARILAQLLHPNIAVIYNFIEQGGNHFMVMEYVEGTSLDDLLKKYGMLPAEFVVPVFIQALEGLQHAHRKNIFHRDIKPANLMIDEDGILKLMDFGIAKVAGEQKMTQVNKIVGTIEFMAPELIEGKEASALSDIYSTGATLYELISGKIPFEGDTDYNIMQSILKSKVKPPDKLNPSVPKALNDIVLKALDKNPEHRYPNARAFQQALIAAFPQYREIDINVLRKAQQTVYATKRTTETILLPTKVEEPMKKLVDRRFENSKPVLALLFYKEKIKEKVLANKKLSLIILGLLFLTITVFSLIKSRNNKSEDTVIAQNDSLKKDGHGAATDGNTGGIVTPQGNIPLTQPDKRITVIEEPINVVPENKEKPKRRKNNEATYPSKKLVINNAAEGDPEPKSPQKKEIYINSEVMVSLALAGTPDMNQKKKQEQRVNFSVTRPVYYNGVLIIRQGARASGSLTIGRMMTDIEIDNVEGANGMRIPLKAERAHGRRNDIESNKPFTAIVQQGTRLSF